MLYIFILAWNLSWAGLMFVVASEVNDDVVETLLLLPTLPAASLVRRYCHPLCVALG